MGQAYGLELLRSARRDPSLVRLEGVHALKHALRFGASVVAVATPDRPQLQRLLAELAPDVIVPVDVVEVDADTWRGLVGRDLPSPALAVAQRPDVSALPAADVPGRLVVLEHPRHLGNLGAVVRVAAAAGAAGVCVVGEADPWHPTAVRSGAGLQFALPACGRVDVLPELRRPVAALDPDGDDLDAARLPADAAIVFGTERGGLSPALLERADLRLRIPMRPGVSSLNLATAAAVVLYA